MYRLFPTVERRTRLRPRPETHTSNVVPVESLEKANEALRAAGVSVESHVIQGLGHGIDETGILQAAQFLRRIREEVAAA